MSLDQLLKKRAEIHRIEEMEKPREENSEENESVKEKNLAKAKKVEERARLLEEERKRKLMISNKREELMNKMRIFEKLRVKSFYVFFSYFLKMKFR